jgi:hypothetical protein
MGVDVEDDEALAGADGRSVAADGKREGCVLQDVAEGAALEVAEVTTGGGRGSTGRGLCQIGEVGSGL